MLTKIALLLAGPRGGEEKKGRTREREKGTDQKGEQRWGKGKGGERERKAKDGERRRKEEGKGTGCSPQWLKWFCEAGGLT